MSLGLSQSAMPAELMRGCRFAQEFRDKSSMLRDGWTLFGTPTVDQGITLNGTTQYATTPVNGVLNNAELTIEIEFYPDFAADDGVSHPFFVTFDNRNYLSHTAGNVLVLRLGNTSGIIAMLADYQALWKIGQRNVLSASATNGAWVARLNGSVFKTSASAFTAENPVLLVLGASAALTPGFAGKITDFRIGHYLATLQEHTDRWEQTTWDWRNLLTYDFKFDLAAYDPVNNRTYDARSTALYAVLGDGAGTGEPTQTTKGYMTFDGVNDYLSGIANPVGSFTIMGMKDTGGGWEFFSHNDLTEWTPIFSSGGFTGNLAALMVAPSVLTPTQEYDAERAIRAALGAQL